MIKKFLTLLFCLLVVPTTGFADKQNTAGDVVHCINSSNGYPDPIDTAPWELAQAILEIPGDSDLHRLADGYHFVRGKRIGHHRTWVAFLKIKNDERVVFKTLTENAELKFFAESFVPSEVIAGFELCGVEWGGYWTEEYSYLKEHTPFVPMYPDFGKCLVNLNCNK